jgi:fucose 4-O-acetylase-like acetyltransferase
MNKAAHIDYLDTLKGLAILLMLIGHCLAWNYEDFLTIIFNGKRTDMFWWHLIYSFHMPLFFWISGYLLPRQSLKLQDLKNLLIKRTYTLLIPFICSGTLMNILTNGEGYSNLWFLRSLYELTFLSLLYEFVKHKYSLDFKSDLLFFCILGLIIWVLSKKYTNNDISELLDLSSISGKNYIGFVFGIFCKRNIKFKRLLDNNYAYTVCLLIFTVLTCTFFLNIDHNKLFKLLFLLTPISAIICMVYICKHHINQKNKITHLLNYLGKYSLEIYIVHFLFGIRFFIITDYATKMIHSEYWRDLLWGHTFMLLTSIIYSAILIVICIPIIQIIRASNILSIILLGRKNE